MMAFMLKLLVNPATGDQGLSPVVIVAAVVAIILVAFLIIWPKFSKKNDDADGEEQGIDTENGQDNNSDKE